MKKSILAVMFLAIVIFVVPNAFADGKKPGNASTEVSSTVETSEKAEKKYLVIWLSSPSPGHSISTCIKVISANPDNMGKKIMESGQGPNSISSYYLHQVVLL